MDGENPVKQAAQGRGADGKFLPSVSGNPTGRPKREHCISDLMYELLTGDPEKVLKKWNAAKKKTGAMRVVIAWYKKLTTADMTALKEALDRVEGKVPQAIEATGKDGGPIRYARELTDDELDAEIERLRRTRPTRREAGAPESASEPT